MQNEVLIVTVSPSPRTKLISWPSSRVLIENEIFEDTGAGDTNGFYDFLRTKDGRIVGIRFTPFVEFSDICDSASPGPGLRVIGTSPTASVELFWGGAGEYDYVLSADQYFDDNYIFKSSSLEYAVTFGFSHLAQNEVEDLLLSLGRSGG